LKPGKNRSRNSQQGRKAWGNTPEPHFRLPAASWPTRPVWRSLAPPGAARHGKKSQTPLENLITASDSASFPQIRLRVRADGLLVGRIFGKESEKFAKVC
jgi:hypothetical protein